MSLLQQQNSEEICSIHDQLKVISTKKNMNQQILGKVKK